MDKKSRLQELFYRLKNGLVVRKPTDVQLHKELTTTKLSAATSRRLLGIHIEQAGHGPTYSGN